VPAGCLLTVDVMVFRTATSAEEPGRLRLEVLLIQRQREPFAGRWALPGGFVEPDEALADAAARELQEETGVHGLPMVAMVESGVYARPGRDPRGRVVSVAYWALLPGAVELAAGDDAAGAAWYPIDALPRPLAFDHEAILAAALNQVRRRLRRGAAALAPFPEHLTLGDLRRLDLPG
jgi:8-oxo-dGTP diphosphatase